MVYVQHQLREEFPESTKRIDELHKINCGFTKMAAEYEFLNRVKVKDKIVACLTGQGEC